MSMTLSIIVPVYNLERYIAKTLENLTSLDLSFDYEIIVINDGSTDKSASIIDDYAKNNKILAYTINNSGVSTARNVGLKKAKGKYIAFVDGDDTIENDFYEVAVYELERGKYDFVQCNYRIVENNLHRYEQFADNDEVIQSAIVMEELFLCAPKKIHNAVWSKVYRASLLQNVRFDSSLIIAEDQKFVFDTLKKASCIKLLHNIGYNYYQRPTSAMHTENLQALLNRLDVLLYFEQSVVSKKAVKALKRQKTKMLINIYDKCKRSKKDSEKYYRMIRSISLFDVYTAADSRICIKFLLLKRFRALYDVLLLKRRAIENE